MRRYRHQSDDRKILLHSGNIRTMDSSMPSAQAMIIDRNLITWIGNNEDIVSIPADEYKLINLHGRTVLPSFTDAHVHFAHFARFAAGLNLESCKSYEEALAAIKKFSSKVRKNEWLVGRGWNREGWKKPRDPHRSDVDKIVPNNPAMFFSKDDHLVWANSLSLKKAGIGRSTPDPNGGRIIRDDSGEPTGILAENAAMLVYSKCSRPTMTASLRYIEEGTAECHRKGVTAVGNFDGIANFELLQQYHSKKGLKIRIRQFVPVSFLDDLLALGIRTNFGSRYLKVSGVKLFADGALGSQTALMYEPYAGSKDNLGVEVLTESDMADRIKAAASGGIACAVHAIGDKANHQVLNAFEKLPRRLRRLRNRIEHVQLIRPGDVPRFAQLGVIASVQPSHCSSDIDMVRRLWGRRSKNAYVFRSIIDSGAAVAFGSDAPIEPINPIAGMYSATTRKSNDGRSRFHPEQRLSIGEAVVGFTSGAAFATCDEGLFGTISPGKSADIVVMDRDPYRIGLDNLRELQVTATFFEGECVYGWEDINS